MRHHLLMHHLATRRDIHDPKLVDRLRRAPSGRWPTLQKLYVLTFADLGATNPKLWNSWQDMLLGELYDADGRESSSAAVWSSRRRRRAPIASASASRPRCRRRGRRRGSQRFLADMPDRYFLSTPEEDIPHHFELVRRYGEEPLVTDVAALPGARVQRVHRRHPRPAGPVRQAHRRAARARHEHRRGAHHHRRQRRGGRRLPRLPPRRRRASPRDDERWERIQSRRRQGAGRRARRRADGRRRPAGRRCSARSSCRAQPTKVEIDNAVSEDFTVIDVFTHDRVGILFAITNALYHLGLSIHLAKITTSVDRVLDVFYVTDSDGPEDRRPGAAGASSAATMLDELKPARSRRVGAPTGLSEASGGEGRWTRRSIAT